MIGTVWMSMRGCLILCSMVWMTVSLAAQDGHWKFIKQDDGIKVYSRKTGDSPIKEIKVQKTMATDLTSLVALMKDVSNHKKWAYANQKGIILKAYNDFSWKFYGYYNAPWPVQDRDMVVEVMLRQDSLTHIVTNEGRCIPDSLPKTSGVVRVPSCQSKWKLVPVGKDSVQVTLEIHTDLGGMLPAWLLNMVSTKGPVYTLEHMEEQVKKPKYRDARLDYIKD